MFLKASLKWTTASQSTFNAIKYIGLLFKNSFAFVNIKHSQLPGVYILDLKYFLIRFCLISSKKNLFQFLSLENMCVQYDF